MIHEAVNEILAVEEKMAQEIARTTEDAKESVVQAEVQAEKIRADVVTKMKADRRKAVEEANADGEKQFNQIVASGKQNAQRLLSTTDRAKAVEFIKEKVLSGYVHR